MEPHEDPALVAQVREALSGLQMARPMEPFSMEEKAAIREAVLTDIQRRAVRERRVRQVRVMVGCTAAATIAIGVGLWTVHSSHSSATEPAQVYTTAPGQRASVALRNGTRMILAPDSRAELSGNVIQLTGQALFEVAPNAARPVAVRTRNASIEVLGTTFMVRQYLGEPESHVVVEDGKVAVQSIAIRSNGTRTSGTRVSRSDNMRRAVLTAAMLGSVSDSGVVVTPRIDVGDHTSWTRGVLTFREMPLRDVLTELARAYDVRITVADSVLGLRRLTLTASVATEPVVRVLEHVGFVTGARLVRQDSAFVLIPGPSRIPDAKRYSFPQQPEIGYGR